jgi:hypothetical protein
LFNETFYLDNNQDVLQAVALGLTTAFEHFSTFGHRENRPLLPFFDTQAYLTASSNSDVLNATTQPGWVSAWNHFVLFGILEGRSPNGTTGFTGLFDNAKYLAQNADVANAVSNGDFRNGFEHYLLFGAKESRAAFDKAGNAIDFQSSLTPGQTFTLTTGADNIVGTSGNDTINGYINTTAGSTDSTLTGADQINGGAGKGDTLNITVSGTNIGFLPGANISGVERFFIRDVNTSGGTSVYNFGIVSGETEVWSDRSTAKVDFSTVGDGATVGLKGDGTTVLGNVRFEYATGTTAVKLAVDGGVGAVGTPPDVTVGGVDLGTTSAADSATITSTGAANKLGTVTLTEGTNSITALTVNAITNLTVTTLAASDYLTTGAALTVSGAASNVNLGSGSTANFKTIDASGLISGGLTIALGTNTTSFKGGQGNDTVTTAAVAATTAGAIDAGAGTGDRLIINSSTDVNTAAKGALYTNFEILRNNVATFAQDASLVAGIIAVETSQNGAGFIKMNATQAAAVTNLVDNSNATFALATATGTNDVLTVTLANPTATNSANLQSVTVTGFETLNVVSSSGSSTNTNKLSFAGGGAGDLTALNLSGAKPIDVNTTNITKAVAINASGITFAPTSGNYALILSGNLVKGSSVTGSGAADKITTTAAIAGTSGDFVIYDAGAGDDEIFSTVAAINNTSGANGSLKIEGGAGIDTLTLTDASLTLVDANFQYITGVEKYVYSGAGAINITTGGFFDINNAAAGATLTLTTTGMVANSIDLTSFSGAAKLTLTANAANTQNQTITTGSGSDTVTVSATGLTTGSLTVNTGAGNDTISITVGSSLNGSVTVNAGLGKDSITFNGVPAAALQNVSITISAGHSTLTDFDTITGYGVSDGTNKGMKLDFDGAATAAANVVAGAVPGYTSAELTYSITNGVLSFAGTAAASLTNAQKASLAQLLVTAANAVVAWSDGTDAYVFHNDTNGDSLVKLVGITTVAGVDTSATTANYIIVG